MSKPRDATTAAVSPAMDAPLLSVSPPPPSPSPSSSSSSSHPEPNHSFVWTLLRKNWWLKKRHPLALAFEILTPALFLLLLSVISHQTHTYSVPSGFSSNANSLNVFRSLGYSAIAPYFTPASVFAETTVTGLLLHMNKLSFEYARMAKTFSASDRAICKNQVVYQGHTSLDPLSDWALPVECRGQVSPFQLAIVPDNTFTRNYFVETMKTWYPRMELALPTLQSTLVVPGFADNLRFYSSVDELETYIKSKDYAKTSADPRLFGALVFDEMPSDDRIGDYTSLNYRIRLNSTYVGQMAMDERYVPFTLYTKAAQWFPFQRAIEDKYNRQYTMGGFMTLQTLVTRFANCMPKWDAQNKKPSGECQATNTTAVNSTELDARLLKTLTSDPATMQVVIEMLQDKGINVTALMSAAGASGAAAGGASALNLTDAQKEIFLKPLRQAPQPYLGATTSPFPIEAYTKSTFYDIVQNVFPFFFVLAYIMTLSKVLVSLISERETRSRELMKILGVKESSIVVSWFITYIVILFISSLLQVAAAKIGVFGSSDPIVMWMFLFFYSLSVLGFGFMMSSMFSSARTGTYIGIIIFFLMQAVSNAFNDGTDEYKKNAACLLSPVALVFAVRVISEVEKNHIGLSFSNWGMPVYNFRMRTALAMLLIDTVIYTILGLYLEKVVPKEYGTTEKWYFPFQPSYWRRHRQQANRGASASIEGAANDVAVNVNSNTEPVSDALRMQEQNGTALCVEGLRKVFSTPTGDKVAVKGVHLNMYAGQISCLLGHNGAGKTTLISMLTGVLPATAGDAFFHGMSIRKDMDKLRESLGICFQHDVLYPELTVEEHLEFYARIKGFDNESFRREISKKIAEVGLVEKRSTQSHALSGGMKRKLSVAISLLGDSSLVFLDEPTSGMDPYSRRSTWEILMNNRHDRVMVLTTHFMDEADILGDRIAIMAEGELRCCGSPLFLKNRYGAGYNLTIVKKEGCDDSKVIDFILGHVSEGQVLSNVGTEVAFQLPIEASSQFASMFRDLDAQLEDLGLLSYGVSVTTMEEVFIKVAEAADDDNEDQQLTLQKKVKRHSDLGASTTPPTSEDPYGVASGIARTRSVFGTQFWALFQKRFRIAKRDKRFGIISLFLPIAWMILGLGLLKHGMAQIDNKTMPLDISELTTEIPSHEILLPSFCETSVGNWCNQVLSNSLFSGATTIELEQNVIGNPPYTTDSPTVFGVEYTKPTINHTDATGYLLKLSEAIYERGFEEDISGQFGGYLVHSDDQNRILSYNVLVNTTIPHGSPIFKQYMDQSIYRLMANQVSPSLQPSTIKLEAANHPFPMTASTTAMVSGILAFTATIFVAIAFGYYPASVVVLLVKERHPDHNSKHQQLVSGVDLTAFWLANYCWDVLVYLIPGGAALILIQAFGMPALTGSAACVACTPATFPTVILLFLLFGLAICPFAYCCSFIFREHAAAQTQMILLQFVIGLLLVIVSFVLQAIESTQDINKVLEWFYRLSPLYDLSYGLLKLTIIEMVNSGGGEWPTPHSNDPMSFDNAAWEMIFLVIDAVVYFALAIGADYALTFPKIKSMLAKDPEIPIIQGDEDEDVALEAERVLMNGSNENDVIQLQHLRKVYRRGGKVAVNDLSFGLKRGECFGFLGINGAGKTTTMKMLTGDIVPSAGGATLSGFDILTQQVEVRRQIGYCPQFDALIDLLSVREHLELFGKIKGVPRANLTEVVEDMMAQLGLTIFADKLAGSLSGGNKRKLSVALAMIGGPSILFLDEPSTGMDPVSRRFMWDVISEISTYNKESTVVLTTHSMEECEALCTRVGIMVGGSLKCLGSVQHLKNRFGDGLKFDAKLVAPTRENIDAFALKLGGVDTSIASAEVAEICTRCGHSDWQAKIVRSHPTGYVLAKALQRDGKIPAVLFATWWLTEERFERVERFLGESFGYVEMLERQHDSCSFKIANEKTEDELKAPTLPLAHVFECLEASKTALSIREYSVSQTTLEQIFNAFASKQDLEVSPSEAITPTPQ